MAMVAPMQQPCETQPSSAAAEAGPVSHLLAQFIDVQRQRAEHYSAFHKAFRAYLEIRNEAAFRQATVATTAAFNDCSKTVIQIEACLRDECKRPDLAAHLRTVQEHEREKLRLTLTLQSLRQAEALNAFSWQRDDADVDPLDPRPATCGCVHGGAGGAGEDDGHVHDQGGAAGSRLTEPTELEFKAAVREAQLALDKHVICINDAIEEVRYEV